MVQPTLTVEMIGLQVGGNLRLPLVAVAEQLLLVVEQLLVRLRGEFEVGTFHDSVHGAGLLRETNNNTLNLVLGQCRE